MKKDLYYTNCFSVCVFNVTNIFFCNCNCDAKHAQRERKTGVQN